MITSTSTATSTSTSSSPSSTQDPGKTSSSKEEDNTNDKNDNYENLSYSEHINKLIRNLSSSKDRCTSLKQLQKELSPSNNDDNDDDNNDNELAILHNTPNNYIKFGAQSNDNDNDDNDNDNDNDNDDNDNDNDNTNSEQCCVHLPPFKWNAFKRGYTIGIWLNIESIKDNITLYQFRQSKYGGIGICCTINPINTSEGDNGDDKYQITIYTLPFSHKRGQYIRSKITFIKNSWQFWCISHDNPYNYYIHRSKLSMSINGINQFTSELLYPTATNTTNTKAAAATNTITMQHDGTDDVVMEENIILGCGSSSSSSSSFEGSLGQILLWKDSFIASTNQISGYIGEIGPNITYQIIIPSIPINRDAMYHDFTSTKKKRSEMGIGTPHVLHNQHTMILSKSESKLQYRFIPSRVKNGLILLHDVILEGEVRSCPKLGVIQPLKERLNNTKDKPNNIAAVKLNTSQQHLNNIRLYQSKYNFTHTFYCIGGLQLILLPLFQVLTTPPGYKKHNLQIKMHTQYLTLRKSFDYTFYTDHVLVFVSQCLLSSLHIREEAVQTGFCSQLSFLVSKILLDQDCSFDNNTDNVDTIHNPIIHYQIKDDFTISLLNGLLSLFHSCCGSSISSLQTSSAGSNTSSSSWDATTSSSIYLRRTSDLALQFINTFVINLSLYKYYPTILSELLLQFIDKYRYLGDFIIKHVSVQYVLDQINMCSATTTTTTTQGNKMDKDSTLQFFHFVLLNSLKYNTKSNSERDVTSSIVNLTISSLGSITSFVVLNTFYNIIESGNVTEMIKLGRCLILSDFHNIIGPVLLSRTVCLFTTEENDNNNNDNNNDDSIAYDWKNQWRIAFLLFIWLTSVSSIEGENASQSFGSLLYKSSISGTLNNCISSSLTSSTENDFLEQILPSTTNTIDRLKSLLPLLPGVFVLLKQDLKSLGGGTAQLLSKILYFFTKFSTNKQLLSTTSSSTSMASLKINKEYIPIFILLFCIIHFNNNTNNNNAQEEEETNLIRETCEKSILDIISKLIIICMNYGNELSLDVWKNINMSLHVILQETLINNNNNNDDEGQQKLLLPNAKQKVLIKICNNVSKSLLSLEQQNKNQTLKDKEQNNQQQPQMIWNVEMTNGISKFILFIKEKNIYKRNPDLLPNLLKMLSYGREDLGWLQTVHLQEHNNTNNDPLQQESTTTSTTSTDDKRISGILAIRKLNISSIHSSSSKYLLPILQPILNMILKLIETNDINNQNNHIVLLINELKLTLSAALIGLKFVHARDTGLQVLVSLRNGLKNISLEQNNNDSDSDIISSSYQELVLFVTNELHARYQNERMVKYSNPEESIGVPDEEIFESRRDNNNNNDDDNNNIDGSSPSTGKHNKESMGWSEYAGLGSALDSACLTNLEEMKENDDDDDNNNNDNNVNIDDYEDYALSKATDNIFTLLKNYLNKWDENLLQDEDECFSIPLFSDDNDDYDNSHKHNQELLLGNKSNHNNNYILSILQESYINNDVQRTTTTRGNYNNDAIVEDTTNNNGDISNIIAHYIEIVSLERNRIDIVKTTIMETIKRETTKTVEYNFWKCYRENYCLPGKDIDEWERAVLQDGGRDSYSRFISVPTKPEFGRSLPEYYLTNNTTKQQQEQQQQPSTEEKEIGVSQSLVGLLGMEIKDIMKETSTPFIDSDLQSKTSSDFAKLSNILATTEETGSNASSRDLSASAASAVSEEETCSNASSRDLIATVASSVSDKNENLDKVTPLDHHTQEYPISPFSLPPDTSSVSSQTTTSTHSIFSSNIDEYYDNCLHVRPEGSRKGVLFLTSSYIMIEYDSNMYEGGESTVRCEGPNFCKWSIAELSHVYLRRYRLRDSAFELFFLPSGGSSSYATSSSAFFDFGPGNIGNQKRDTAANAILKRAPHQCTKQWPEKSQSFFSESLNRITLNWCCGNLSNFDYLMELNILAGRSFNDLCQYPIFPWVLCNYSGNEIPDLNDIRNFRDMTRPMGALNEDRLRDFIERFETFSDPHIPPFMYGSHYSTSAGVVLHFLVRLHPYANLHRQLQGGHFDVADRIFSNIERTYEMCTGASTSEVKELTPEWYCNPDFLRNSNNFYLGQSQDGELLGDVVLPPWAKGSADKFVEVMRSALESKCCTYMLPSWIDLIFGFKQTGPEARRANNVYYHLTYYGSIDVASIEDEGLRTATELQIAHFGQCPMQLFWRPHISKLSQTSSRFKYSLNHVWDNRHLHFEVAKLSDWVHLPCPPPAGKKLIMVKICGTEKIVAVDENGIFHFFRWGWKPNEVSEEEKEYAEPDTGCFVAQRELPNFKSVPRLAYSSPENGSPVVAISRTMFASGSLLLVLSDGDGKGALSLQFLDVNKNLVKGIAIIPCVHSSRITCIATDTMGSSSHLNYQSGGGGGVGGELAITGSEDGSATLWRFISSHYLPLRPRLRLRGHYGSAILSAAISSSLNICVTVSSTRCCLFHLGNGQLLRSFPPVEDSVFGEMSCLSINGFIILLCLTPEKAVITLYSLEGVLLGTRELLEPPRNMTVIQRNVVCTCASDGAQFYLLSATDPLRKIDAWHFSKGAYDVDVGPYPKQIVAAMASSSGSLVLHALPGITLFSEENRKVAISAAVGNALAKPAQKIKSAVGTALNRVKGAEDNAGSNSNANTSGGITGFFQNAFRKQA